MNARLSLGAAGVTLLATTATLGLLHWMQLALYATDRVALLLLEIGFPALLAIVAPVVANQPTPPRTSGRRVARLLLLSVGLSINYTCVSLLFAPMAFGETIRVESLWLFECTFVGALAGIAFADWYGRRSNFVLPPSRVRKYVFWIVGIASSFVAVMIIVPMTVFVGTFVFVALALKASAAGS